MTKKMLRGYSIYQEQKNIQAFLQTWQSRRYYIDLLDTLNTSFQKIASGKYDKKDVERLFDLSRTKKYPSLFTDMAESDVERLFDLSRTKKYPSLFTDMAESFAMMMVKVEARDFQLQQTLEELEKLKAKT
jgi:hypothetical protein